MSPCASRFDSTPTRANQGYHHIMGYLIVQEQESAGSLIGENVQWIKLVLRGIPKIEQREFVWERTDNWG